MGKLGIHKYSQPKTALAIQAVFVCNSVLNIQQGLPFYVTAETGSVESTLLQISDAMKTNLMNMNIEMNLS